MPHRIRREQNPKLRKLFLALLRCTRFVGGSDSRTPRLHRRRAPTLCACLRAYTWVTHCTVYRARAWARRSPSSSSSDRPSVRLYGDAIANENVGIHARNRDVCCDTIIVRGHSTIGLWHYIVHILYSTCTMRAVYVSQNVGYLLGGVPASAFTRARDGCTTVPYYY